jgi:hypothetical protein
MMEAEKEETEGKQKTYGRKRNRRVMPLEKQ